MTWRLEVAVLPDPLAAAEDKINGSVKGLKDGLDPDVLAYWYKRVEDRSVEQVPDQLKDKIHFEQDRILWLKFRMDVSKRAVPYVMQVIDEYIPLMPYSTGLYFRKVQEILTSELTKDLC